MQCKYGGYMLNLNWCLTWLALPGEHLCQFLALFWLFTLDCWHWTEYWAGAGGWSINLLIRDASDATNQIFLLNYFTFQLKKYSILKDKWINISIYVSCILSASLAHFCSWILWSVHLQLIKFEGTIVKFSFLSCLRESNRERFRN